VFSSHLAIGCLLAILAPRLPKIPRTVAILMLATLILIPWFAGNTPARTLFLLFVLFPLLNVSAAGLVLHVIQAPYRALNWQPVAWLGRISYSLYLWQELFCSNAAFRSGYLLILPSIACACLSYYLVERPMLRMRDRLDLRSTSGARQSAPVQELPLAREA
jgi:peptidoglycan/LPS O-acetylase OafA/YrhL